MEGIPNSPWEDLNGGLASLEDLLGLCLAALNDSGATDSKVRPHTIETCSVGLPVCLSSRGCLQVSATTKKRLQQRSMAGIHSGKALLKVCGILLVLPWSKPR